ncbi:hypothetical protein F4823DRAFT_599433 [Ustulina deusta]|nr:hypothetical protein F4823DRAFT_599433 [Ustulina deusta]
MCLSILASLHGLSIVSTFVSLHGTCGRNAEARWYSFVTDTLHHVWFLNTARKPWESSMGNAVYTTVLVSTGIYLLDPKR